MKIKAGGKETSFCGYVGKITVNSRQFERGEIGHLKLRRQREGFSLFLEEVVTIYLC